MTCASIFSGQKDLERVQDADLLRACREIGLLSAVGFTQIDLIRYMRNHASAAHPNRVQLTGLQLDNWLVHRRNRHGEITNNTADRAPEPAILRRPPAA